jgi:hypothetical protein
MGKLFAGTLVVGHVLDPRAVGGFF